MDHSLTSQAAVSSSKAKRIETDDLILVASGLVTYAIVIVVDATSSNLDNARLLIISLMAMVFSLSTLWPRISHSRPMQCLALACQCFGALVIYWQQPTLVASILFVICAAQMPTSLGLKWWWAGLVVINGGVLLIDSQHGLTQSKLITNLVFLCFELFAALSARSRMIAKEQQELLQATNLKLIAAQSMLSQQSESQERLRIARNLHDSIGHKLTALSLTLEHAIYRPPVDNNEFFKQLKQGVNDTLSQTRSIVQHMRQQSGVSIEAFIEQLQTGLPDNIQVHSQVDDSGLSPLQSEQLAYCIQEAVSNAVRHGRANQINVELSQQDEVALTISDNGRGCSTYASGSGLNGIQERVVALNGEVSITATQPHFCIHIRLPKAEESLR